MTLENKGKLILTQIKKPSLEGGQNASRVYCAINQVSNMKNYYNVPENLKFAYRSA